MLFQEPDVDYLRLRLNRLTIPTALLRPKVSAEPTCHDPPAQGRGSPVKSDSVPDSVPSVSGADTNKPAPIKRPFLKAGSRNAPMLNVNRIGKPAATRSSSALTPAAEDTQPCPPAVRAAVSERYADGILDQTLPPLPRHSSEPAPCAPLSPKALKSEMSHPKSVGSANSEPERRSTPVESTTDAPAGTASVPREARTSEARDVKETRPASTLGSTSCQPIRRTAEHAAVIQRALLSAMKQQFPYEHEDTLQYVYILALTHHVHPSMAIPYVSTENQANTPTESRSEPHGVRPMQNRMSFLDPSLRHRTFPSHLNVLLEIEESASIAQSPQGSPSTDPADAADRAKPASPPTSAESVSEERGRWKERSPLAQLFGDSYDSFYVILKDLSPRQRQDWLAHHDRHWPPKSFHPDYEDGECPSSPTSAPLESDSIAGFTVLDGDFVHFIDRAEWRREAASSAAGTTATPSATSSGAGTGSGSGVSRRVSHPFESSTTARDLSSGSTRVSPPAHAFVDAAGGVSPSHEEKEKPQMSVSAALEQVSRGLRFSVFRIPIFLLPVEDQDYYSAIREEDRFVSTVEGDSALLREKASNLASGDLKCAAFRSIREETKRFKANLEAIEAMHAERTNFTAAAAAGLSEKTIPAHRLDILRSSATQPTRTTHRQDRMERFFESCATQLRKYMHNRFGSPSASSEEHSATVERVLFSMAPCDAYHLVMDESNPLYYARSVTAPYKARTVNLTLLSAKSAVAPRVDESQRTTALSGTTVAPEPGCVENAQGSAEANTRGAGRTDDGLVCSRAVSPDPPHRYPLQRHEREVSHFTGKQVGEQGRSNRSAVLDTSDSPKESSHCGRPESRSPSPVVLPSPGSGSVTSAVNPSFSPSPQPLPAVPHDRTASCSHHRTPVSAASGGSAAAGSRCAKCREEVYASYLAFAPNLPAQVTNSLSQSTSCAVSEASSLTEGFLSVTTTLCTNNISGNTRNRGKQGARVGGSKAPSLVERGIGVPAGCSRSSSKARQSQGQRSVGHTEAEPTAPLQKPEPSSESADEQESGCAAVDAEPVENLFQLLASSSLAQHELRHGTIRPVVSLAVVQHSASASVQESGDTGGSSLACRALVDHTWLSLPIQSLKGCKNAIEWTPAVFGSSECVSDVGYRTAIHVGLFEKQSGSAPAQWSDGVTELVDVVPAPVERSAKPSSAEVPSRMAKVAQSTFTCADGRVTEAPAIPPPGATPTEEAIEKPSLAEEEPASITLRKGGMAMVFEMDCPTSKRPASRAAPPSEAPGPVPQGAAMTNAPTSAVPAARKLEQSPPPSGVERPPANHEVLVFDFTKPARTNTSRLAKGPPTGKTLAEQSRARAAAILAQRRREAEERRRADSPTPSLSAPPASSVTERAPAMSATGDEPNATFRGRGVLLEHSPPMHAPTRGLATGNEPTRLQATSTPPAADKIYRDFPSSNAGGCSGVSQAREAVDAFCVNVQKPGGVEPWPPHRELLPHEANRLDRAATTAAAQVHGEKMPPPEGLGLRGRGVAREDSPAPTGFFGRRPHYDEQPVGMPSRNQNSPPNSLHTPVRGRDAMHHSFTFGPRAINSSSLAGAPPRSPAEPIEREDPAYVHGSSIDPRGRLLGRLGWGYTASHDSAQNPLQFPPTVPRSPFGNGSFHECRPTVAGGARSPGLARATTLFGTASSRPCDRGYEVDRNRGVENPGGGGDSPLPSALGAASGSLSGPARAGRPFASPFATLAFGKPGTLPSQCSSGGAGGFGASAANQPPALSSSFETQHPPLWQRSSNPKYAESHGGGTGGGSPFPRVTANLSAQFNNLINSNNSSQLPFGQQTGTNQPATERGTSSLASLHTFAASRRTGWPHSAASLAPSPSFRDPARTALSGAEPTSWWGGTALTAHLSREEIMRRGHRRFRDPNTEEAVRYNDYEETPGELAARDPIRAQAGLHMNGMAGSRVRRRIPALDENEYAMGGTNAGKTPTEAPDREAPPVFDASTPMRFHHGFQRLPTHEDTLLGTHQRNSGRTYNAYMRWPLRDSHPRATATRAPVPWDSRPIPPPPVARFGANYWSRSSVSTQPPSHAGPSSSSVLRNPFLSRNTECASGVWTSRGEPTSSAWQPGERYAASTYNSRYTMASELPPRPPASQNSMGHLGHGQLPVSSTRIPVRERMTLRQMRANAALSDEALERSQVRRASSPTTVGGLLFGERMARGAAGFEVEPHDRSVIVYPEELNRKQAELSKRMAAYGRQMSGLCALAESSELGWVGSNVSVTLRDIANAMLLIPPASARSAAKGRPSSCLPEFDLSQAALFESGVSCFVASADATLRAASRPEHEQLGWGHYLRQLNYYQEPLYLRERTLVFVLRVPQHPDLRVLLAVHHIDDFVAVLSQSPLAIRSPSKAPSSLPRADTIASGVPQNAGDDESRKCAESESGRKTGLLRRLLAKIGVCRRSEAEGEAPGCQTEADCAHVTLTWRHRWTLLKLQARETLASPTANDSTSLLLRDPRLLTARASFIADRIAAYTATAFRLSVVTEINARSEGWRDTVSPGVEGSTAAAPWRYPVGGANASSSVAASLRGPLFGSTVAPYASSSSVNVIRDSATTLHPATRPRTKAVRPQYRMVWARNEPSVSLPLVPVLNLVPLHRQRDIISLVNHGRKGAMGSNGIAGFSLPSPMTGAPTGLPASYFSPLPTPTELQRGGTGADSVSQGEGPLRFRTNHFNIAIAQVQQLLQWQWEHYQMTHEEQPTLVYISGAQNLSESLMSFFGASYSPGHLGRNGRAEGVSTAIERESLLQNRSASRIYSTEYRNALSPLSRLLLVFLLRWSWLVPLDYDAGIRSAYSPRPGRRRHQMASPLAVLGLRAFWPSSLRSMFVDPLLDLLWTREADRNRKPRVLWPLVLTWLMLCIKPHTVSALLVAALAYTLVRSAAAQVFRGARGSGSTVADSIDLCANLRDAERSTREVAAPPLFSRTHIVYMHQEATVEETGWIVEDARGGLTRRPGARNQASVVEYMVVTRLLQLQHAYCSFFSRLALFMQGFAPMLSLILMAELLLVVLPLFFLFVWITDALLHAVELASTRANPCRADVGFAFAQPEDNRTYASIQVSPLGKIPAWRSEVICHEKGISVDAIGSLILTTSFRAMLSAVQITYHTGIPFAAWLVRQLLHSVAALAERLWGDDQVLANDPSSPLFYMKDGAGFRISGKGSADLDAPVETSDEYFEALLHQSGRLSKQSAVTPAVATALNSTSAAAPDVAALLGAQQNDLPTNITRVATSQVYAVAGALYGVTLHYALHALGALLQEARGSIGVFLLFLVMVCAHFPPLRRLFRWTWCLFQRDDALSRRVVLTV